MQRRFKPSAYLGAILWEKLERKAETHVYRKIWDSIFLVSPYSGRLSSWVNVK